MAHLCQNISFFMLTNRRRNTTFSATSVHFYYFGTAAKFCRTSRQYTSTRPTRHDLFAPILCGANRRSTSWFSSRYAKNVILFSSFVDVIMFRLTVIGSSAANGRPSLMELPYLPPLFMARSDQGGATDYSRPPPPGSQSSAGGPSPIPGNNSCFNCGASGHRGTQCQQITFDEIINPSPV